MAFKCKSSHYGAKLSERLTQPQIQFLTLSNPFIFYPACPHMETEEENTSRHYMLYKWIPVVFLSSTVYFKKKTFQHPFHIHPFII